MSFSEAFWRTWGPILTWIFQNLWLVVGAITFAIIATMSVKAAKEAKTERAKKKASTAKVAKSKKPSPKLITQRTNHMLEFFLYVMDEKGRPGLHRINRKVFDDDRRQAARRHYDAESLIVSLNARCWQQDIPFKVHDDTDEFTPTWRQVIISPDGKWAIVGDMPLNIDGSMTKRVRALSIINGPLESVLSQWHDALRVACVALLTTHSPDDVEEFNEIAFEEEEN